jgi:hypothetical protein
MCQLYCVIKAHLKKQTFNNNIDLKKKKLDIVEDHFLSLNVD